MTARLCGFDGWSYSAATSRTRNTIATITTTRICTHMLASGRVVHATHGMLAPFRPSVREVRGDTPGTVARSD